MADITIALAGNPNAGKTTIFNALTGLRQHTGNWPGKTVEKKKGGSVWKIEDQCCGPARHLQPDRVFPEEIIARDFIIESRPDVVINVVDATNLERNLYLTVQLLELDVPVVMALNMTDDLQKDGSKINLDQLSRFLGEIPIVSTTANRGTGISELISKAVGAAKNHDNDHTFSARLRRQTRTRDRTTDRIIFRVSIDTKRYPQRWLALKLLEADAEILEQVRAMPNGEQVISLAMQSAEKLKSMLGDDVDMLIADRRYGFINGVVRQSLHRPPAWIASRSPTASTTSSRTSGLACPSSSR
jgi:ferrous iron transport protein B